jgi:hypothetical protein
MKPREWTPEETNLALSMWNDKVPAKQIAEKLGRTRNAIIGRMHRINAPPSQIPNTFQKKNKLASKVKVKAKVKMVVVKPKPVVVTEDGVTLLDLNDGMCKWILPNNHYCGQSAMAFNKPYCLNHMNKSRGVSHEKRTVQFRSYK